MASPAPNAGEIFDLQRIRRLAKLMNDQDLSEIDLQQDGARLRLRRGHAVSVPAVSVAAPAPVSGAGAAVPAAPTAADDAHVALVTSPMVGTFYSASSPESPAFAKVGDHVNAETIVCIVEAMKVFNEIPAGVAGRVIAVLVENGDPVEYGQPLFKIDTRG
jgi:acetyl-CoA carboxylase biotin carboxyl carrier protein